MAVTRARIGADLFDVGFRPGVRAAAPVEGGGPEEGIPSPAVLGETRVGDSLYLFPDEPDPERDPRRGRESQRAQASRFPVRPAAGQGTLFAGREARPRGGPRAAGAPPTDRGAPAAGVATDRQIGYAHDISKALRIPLPEGRDVEAVSAFIALHGHRLKGNRGRP